MMVDSGPRYIIGVKNEAGASPRERAKREYYCAPLKGSPANNQVFKLLEVTGPATNPAVVLELNDTKERANVDKDHPFQRTEGYAADLRYEPEHKTWTKRRVGSVLAFNGAEYEVRAITEKEVVVSAKSNNRKWAIPFEGAPENQGGGAPKP